jgi:hypothetical protein
MKGGGALKIIIKKPLTGGGGIGHKRNLNFGLFFVKEEKKHGYV